MGLNISPCVYWQDDCKTPVNAPKPIGPNLYPNWELVGGSDITQDVPDTTLPDGHNLAFNNADPCDAYYIDNGDGTFRYEFNLVQAPVRLALQQTIQSFEVGKTYRFQAEVRTATNETSSSDVRAVHIAATIDLNIIDSTNSFIGENVDWTLRWIDFEVTDSNGRGNFRFGAGVFDVVTTEQDTKNIAIYELG